MSLKTFIFPAHGSKPLTMVGAFVAAIGIYNGVHAFSKEQPERAAVNFLAAAAAATISSRSRKVWVLREENELLQNELMKAHAELMAYKFTDIFSGGSKFYQEEDGEIIEGDFVREVPETAEAATLSSSPR